MASLSAVGTLTAIALGVDADTYTTMDTRAAYWADGRAGDLVTGISGTTKDEVKRIIAKGLEDGLSNEEIAQELSSAYAFSPERALLIANTEVANANSVGSLIAAQIAEAGGLSIKKLWVPDAIACPVCLANADEGPIPLDEEFPSGDMQPLAHPYCGCVLAYEISETKEKV